MTVAMPAVLASVVRGMPVALASVVRGVISSYVNQKMFVHKFKGERKRERE